MNAQSRKHEIEFTVDDETLETTEKELTPRQILELAQIDPAENYLVLIKHGKPHTSYETTPDTPIHVHAGEVFASVFTGPTHVS